MANPEQLAQFEQVISGLLSADNKIRGEAEKMFEQTKQQPDLLFRALTELFRTSQKSAIRQFVAVMIRQNMQKDELWGKASQQTKEFLKQTLLGLLKTEHAKEIRQKTSDLIGVLAGKVFSKNSNQSSGWNELFPCLFEVAQSSHSLHRISVYNVLEVVAEFSMETMRPHLQPVKQLLCIGLKDAQRSTQLHALKAMVAVLIEMTLQEREHMADVVPLLFQIVMIAFQANDDDNVCESVKILVELARCEPTFLRSALADVVKAMVQIAGAGRLDDSARQMAFEFLLTLSETGKGMTRKLASYSDDVIRLAFQFMIEIKTPLEEWNSASTPDDLDEENYNVGLEAIGRLAHSLGGSLFLPRAIPITQQFLSSSEWTHRHAALMTLGHMSEGCNKELKIQLEHVVRLVLPHATDNKHPRVQWAAVDALAHFSDKFAPTFQQKFHEQVMKSLLVCMNSSQPRVVAHGALCLVDFCRGIHSEAPEFQESDDITSNIITAYADPILETLQKIIQMNNIKVQEATIAAIASVAAVCEKNFAKYYDPFIQGVKSILTSATGKHQRELRGRAVECIALIAKAVGRERFAPDFKSVMEFLISTQKAGLACDDPQYEYVVQACARICQCVGEAFIPYLSFVIPPLLKSVSINNAVQITELGKRNADEGKDGFQSLTVALRGSDDKRVTINTSLLEEQGTACQMLYQYAHELKDGFFPYVDSTAKALVPLAHCPFNEIVRLAATAALPALLTCAQMHFKKQGVNDNGYVDNLWNFMFPALLHAIQVEIHIDNLTDRLDTFGACLDIVKCPLTVEQIHLTNDLLAAVVRESITRRNELEKRRQDQDFDEQENAQLEEDHEQEDYLISNVNTCILYIVRNCGESYMDSFHKFLYPLFFPMLGPNRTSGEQTIGLCVMDAVVQYGGTKAHQYLEKYLPITKQYASSSDTSIRQAAVFGIGVCAQSLGEKFASIGEEFLIVLVQVITATGSRNEENGPATDNAISALGRICHSCYKEPPVIQGKNLLELWFRMLPIRDDEEEISSVTEMLCDFVDRQNPHVLGVNNNNLPKIVSVFAETLRCDLTEENTKRRIKVIMNRLQSSLTPKQMQDVMSLINQKQQQQMQTSLAAIV